MTRKYSNRTLDEMAHFIARNFRHTQMDSLFLSVSVPQEFHRGSNKLKRALNVLTKLADPYVSEFEDILDKLFKEVIARRKGLFESCTDPYSGVKDPAESAQRLLQALRADGYEVRDGKIVSSDSLETELAQETSILYERLQFFNMQDVYKNLEQAHQSFIEGHYEACNAMLRTGFESTLQHVAEHLAGSLDNVPRANSKYLTPTDVRKYLAQEGFFSDDELKYIKEFYGYASTDGSHPGISNEAESRLRRLMIVALIQYCLEKLSSWT